MFGDIGLFGFYISMSRKTCCGAGSFMAENMTSIWGINRGDDLKKLLQLAVVFSPLNLRHARSALTWLLGERAWSWAKIKVPSLKLT